MINRLCLKCNKPMNGGVYRHPDKCPHCFSSQDELIRLTQGGIASSKTSAARSPAVNGASDYGVPGYSVVEIAAASAPISTATTSTATTSTANASTVAWPKKVATPTKVAPKAVEETKAQEQKPRSKVNAPITTERPKSTVSLCDVYAELSGSRKEPTLSNMANLDEPATHSLTARKKVESKKVEPKKVEPKKEAEQASALEKKKSAAPATKIIDMKNDPVLLSDKASVANKRNADDLDLVSVLKNNSAALERVREEYSFELAIPESDCADEHVVEQTQQQDLQRILLTTESAQDLKIKRRLGMVSAECCFSLSLIMAYFSELKALMSSGSDLTDASHLSNTTPTNNALKQARKKVLEELRREAAELNANAVINVRINHSQLSNEGEPIMLLMASGVAVTL